MGHIRRSFFFPLAFLVAVVMLAVVQPARAMVIESLEDELARVEAEKGELQAQLGTIRHFPHAKNKVAVFTFEDPDETGLGDTLSFLTSKRVLFDAGVGSLAVVLFQQGLAPDASGYSYFEKVDKVTQGQGYLISIWGRIAREAGQLIVDTFVEFYPDAVGTGFDIALDIPGLDEDLRASVRPTRLWIQQLQFDDEDAKRLIEVEDAVRLVRESPNAESESLHRLSEGRPFWIIQRDRTWVQLGFQDAPPGWTSVEQFCLNVCRKLLDSSDFAIMLMRYANGYPWGPPPPNVTLEAQAVIDQMLAFQNLAAGSNPGSIRDQASRWAGYPSAPGGAAFANLSALAHVRELQRAGSLTPTEIRSIALDLARASLDDPGNLDVLHNLSVLFRYAGDLPRATLASKLYQKQSGPFLSPR